MVTIAEYLSNPVLIARKARWLALYHGDPREVTLDTLNGRLTFHSRDRIIGRQLFLRRGFEVQWMDQSLEFLRAESLLGPPGGRVLDVGANIGMICIALLLRGQFEAATGFEPEPRNFGLLGRNIAQNGLAARVEAMQLALSSAAGEMEMELSEYNSGDHRIRTSAAEGAFGESGRRTVQVRVERLDDVVARSPASFDDVRLVWLDIQGHEAHFLRGARGFFERGVPLVSEFWPYGILRSGVSRDSYVETVSSSFTHAYVLEKARLRCMETAALGDLFDSLDGHTDMRQMILVRR